MFNITFLNTIFLLGLIAGLLPILIHIFNKRKLKTIEFSSLRFLRLTHKKRIRRLKLKQILLLIIRTLIILLIALALARPALKGVFVSSVQAHAKTTVAIVLDNSFSMNLLREDGYLFGTAQKKCLEIVDLLKEGDDAVFILMSDYPNAVFEEPTYNFDLLREEIQDAEISERPTDVAASLQKAYELLSESKNLNKELYLITDMQKMGWESVQELDDDVLNQENVRTYLIPVRGEITENTCIEKIDYSNQLIQMGEPVLFRMQVRNFGEEAVSDRLLQLAVDGKRMAQAGISVEPGKSNSTVLSVTFDNADAYSGHGELAEDLLYSDNTRYFSIKLNSNPDVLIVDGSDSETSAGLFVKYALAPPGADQTLINPTLVKQDRFSKQDLEKYQTIILSNVNSLDFNELAKLESFVSQGGGLMVLLGDKINVKYYNETFFPRFLSMKLINVVGTENQEDTFISWGKIDYEHPIFQIFKNDESGDLSQAQFYMSYDAQLDLENNSIVNFSNGSPAIVEGQRGSGKVIVFNTLPDLEWSDLPVRGFFVPVVHRTVQYLSGNSVGERNDYLVGDVISKQVDRIPYGQAAKIIKPDSSEFFLEPITTEKNLLLKFTDTDLAGHYDLYIGDQNIETYSVNLDIRESNLKSMETDEVNDHFDELVLIEESEPLERAILESRYGRELWKEFLFAVLVLMILEMIIARDKKDEMEEEK